MAAETDQYGRPKYRIHRIEGKRWLPGCRETLADQSEIQDGSHGRYNIEYKGKEISEDRVLLLSYGKGKRLFRIADVSNGDIEEVSRALLSEGTSS
jgi:RNA polymerase-associated protein RTF1